MTARIIDLDAARRFNRDAAAHREREEQKSGVGRRLRLVPPQTREQRLESALRACIADEFGLYACGLNAGLAPSFSPRETRAMKLADDLDEMAREALEP